MSDKPAPLPTEGGSYTVQKGGALKRTAFTAPADEPGGEAAATPAPPAEDPPPPNEGDPAAPKPRTRP